MRKAIVALSMSAFALASFSAIDTASAATAKMSKMGCVVGKQKWDAKVGKCVDAKPVKKAVKSMKKPAAVKSTKKPVAKVVKKAS